MLNVPQNMPNRKIIYKGQDGYMGVHMVLKKQKKTTN